MLDGLLPAPCSSSVRSAREPAPVARSATRARGVSDDAHALPPPRLLSRTEHEHRPFLSSLPPGPGPRQSAVEGSWGGAPRSRPGIGTHGAQRAAPSPPLGVAVREVPRGGCRAFSRPPGPTPAPTVRPAARRRGPVGDDNSRPGRTGNIPLEVDPAGRSDAHPTHGYARGRPSGGRPLGHPATSCEASAVTSCEASAPTRPGPHPRRLLGRRASSAPRRIAKRGSGAPDGAVLDSPA